MDTERKRWPFHIFRRKPEQASPLPAKSSFTLIREVQNPDGSSSTQKQVLLVGQKEESLLYLHTPSSPVSITVSPSTLHTLQIKVAYADASSVRGYWHAMPDGHLTHSFTDNGLTQLQPVRFNTTHDPTTVVCGEKMRIEYRRRLPSEES
jgi:hypothetical protein